MSVPSENPFKCCSKIKMNEKVLGKFYLHSPFPNPDARVNIAHESPQPMPPHIECLLIGGEAAGDAVAHSDQACSVGSVLLTRLAARRPH